MILTVINPKHVILAGCQNINQTCTYKQTELHFSKLHNTLPPAFINALLLKAVFIVICVMERKDSFSLIQFKRKPRYL